MISLSVLPTVNAFLNGTCAILLIIGYSHIRKKRIKEHKKYMLAALGTSILFLTSYLIYHFYSGSTPYQGQGMLRVVYFTILLTHTILATAIVPLVVITFYRAYTEQFDHHARIARWTLPLWLYVSVTGVIVYLMLYQM